MSDENVLGPYRLLRKLGEGGMGTVFLGHDETLLRHVAIKVLRIRDDSTERANTQLAKRFLREAQSAARLNHANVVTIYNVGQHAGRPFIAMEYVEGGSLADRLRKGVIDWRTATQAVRDALLALAAAHEAGVIHRDIKPANLMVAKNGGIKLVDFGLARILELPADGDITFVGAFVGSPSYASPEQTAGAQNIDGRSDLYSLAATWYALLTGQPPFVDDDPAELMRRHLTEPFPDVRALAPAVPAELVAVLQKASRKHVPERYENAEKMRAAVDGILNMPQAVVERVAMRLAPALRADDTLVELESRLEIARSKSDSTTQLATLRSLYGLYTQLDRRTEANRAFREAMVVHVELSRSGALEKAGVGWR